MPNLMVASGVPVGLLPNSILLWLNVRLMNSALFISFLSMNTSLLSLAALFSIAACELASS